MRRVVTSAICVIVLLISLAPAARAQHTITTVAGGVPNNVPALPVGVGASPRVFKDSAGNLYISVTVNGTQGLYGNVVYKVDSFGQLTTVAGNGTEGFSGDGGPATSAALSGPHGLFVDGFGNIFIADTYNDRIRKVVAATGNIQTVAGNGTLGFSGDGGPAISAALSDPEGVFLDRSGNLFIADTGNSRIRKVVAATGNIQTVAGTGTFGFSGDGGPAISAALNVPDGVYVDRSGNLFISDTFNNRIREVVATTGNIQTVAGNGTQGFSGDGGPATSASLYFPEGVFVDSSGNIFTADHLNGRIREVDVATGTIQTVAGNGTFGFSGDGGPATNAELAQPTGVYVDSSGNMFIVDTFNSRIREVDAATGIIQTVAGNGTFGFSGDGGPATSAELDLRVGFSNGITGDRQGNLLIAEESNSRIRRISGLVAVVGITDDQLLHHESWCHAAIHGKRH